VNSPVSVLLITPGFAANEQDDTCIPPLQLLVKALQQQHIQVFIIALEYPFQSTPYEWYGARVLPCNGKNRKWMRLRTHARAQRWAQQLIPQENIRVLYSFWLGQAWQLGKKLAADFNIPHFTTLMGQDVLWKNNRRYLRKLSDSDLPNLVAVSNFQAQQLELETSKKPGFIIPWAIDSIDISQKTNEPRPIDILGVGSLLPVKNWIKWLEVVQLLVQKHPHTRALLIGDGPQKAKIVDFIQKNGLSQNIHLTGALSRQEVLGYMLQSNILLHTSQFESFGYVMAEARACGCSVVSTPVGIAGDVGVTGKTVADLAALISEPQPEDSSYFDLPGFVYCIRSDAPNLAILNSNDLIPFSVQTMVNRYIALIPVPVHPESPKAFRKE
jgi:glycosyltransferase involved in cell wall biosynthesis